MEFILPRSALPDNKAQRRMLLDEYFPQGIIPFELLVGQEWKLTSFVPDDPDYYVDPLIAKTLENWNEPITLETMGSYRRIYKNAMISFIDSWSLYYWSLFVKWLSTKGEVPKQLNILHVDDHLDLDTPLIITDAENFECLFSGEKVSLEDPASIEKSIIQKSIGIGSFFAPLLHGIEKVNILHLRYAHQGKPHENGLECTFKEDTLLAKRKQRPSLTKTKSDSRHRYIVASTPAYLLDKLENPTHLLLHLDCDALNNRYNGNSLWHTHSPSIDLNLRQIKDKIDELFYQVSLLSAKVYINVALSPGFFPSDLWKPISDYIFEKAEKHGVIRDDHFSEYLNDHHPKEVRNGSN